MKLAWQPSSLPQRAASGGSMGKSPWLPEHLLTHPMPDPCSFHSSYLVLNRIHPRTGDHHQVSPLLMYSCIRANSTFLSLPCQGASAKESSGYTGPLCFVCFFFNTVHRRQYIHAYTHPYEHRRTPRDENGVKTFRFSRRKNGMKRKCEYGTEICKVKMEKR